MKRTSLLAYFHVPFTQVNVCGKTPVKATVIGPTQRFVLHHLKIGACLPWPPWEMQQDI